MTKFVDKRTQAQQELDARIRGLTCRLDSHDGLGYSTWVKALQSLGVEFALIRTRSAGYVMTKPEYVAPARVLALAARDADRRWS